MQFTGLQIVSAVVLLIGTGLLAVAIGTSSWSEYKINSQNEHDVFEDRDVTQWIDGPLNGSRGLWEFCREDKDEVKEKGEDVGGDENSKKTWKCKNRFSALMEKDTAETHRENLHKSDYKVWEIVCLAFMCSSVLLGILSLLASPCCCNRCGCCLALFVLFAALAAATGISVYAYYHAHNEVLVSDLKPIAFEISEVKFGYSFWCAVAGGACQLIASLLFAVSRGRSHNYSHQI